MQQLAKFLDGQQEAALVDLPHMEETADFIESAIRSAITLDFQSLI
jgi:hypothetical protein